MEPYTGVTKATGKPMAGRKTKKTFFMEKEIFSWKTPESSGHEILYRCVRQENKQVP